MAHVAITLPGAPEVPAWMATGADLLAGITQALNHKSHRERWKYTRVQPVLDLLSQPAAAPAWKNLPKGVSLSVIQRTQTQAPVPDIFSRQLQATAARAPEAAALLCYQPMLQLLDVTGRVKEPLIINHTASSCPVVIRLADNAKLDLRETFASASAEQLQSLWIELGAGSRLVHSRNSYAPTSHWQFLGVQIGQDAAYRLHNHTAGAPMRRQDMHILCAARGAHAEIVSAAQVGNTLHLDQQITVEHTAPDTTSRQTFHNIADGGARVTFNGRIHIHEQCSQADARLTNRNLSVGENAVINTKPELEIYTDDVQCAHGATVGQLDDNHLFYCASRGIVPEQARLLLSRAFLNQCILGPLAGQAQGILLERVGA